MLVAVPPISAVVAMRFEDTDAAMQMRFKVHTSFLALPRCPHTNEQRVHRSHSARQSILPKSSTASSTPTPSARSTASCQCSPS
jgi:hypothetical protein